MDSANFASFEYLLHCHMKDFESGCLERLRPRGGRHSGWQLPVDRGRTTDREKYDSMRRQLLLHLIHLLFHLPLTPLV